MRELVSPVVIWPAAIVRQQSPNLANLVHQSEKAIWDTGATNSVISEALFRQMGLPTLSMAPVSGVTGNSQLPVTLIDIGLLNGVRVPNVRVSVASVPGFDVLIGMDIISIGDFAVTQANGQTMFSFMYPPGSKHIDFTEPPWSSSLGASPPPSAGGASQRKKSRRKH